MYNFLGPDYLRAKLKTKKDRVDIRYGFYEMKNHVPDFGISTPPGLAHLKSICGWSSKSVDTFADRIVFHHFKNDPFDLDGIYSEASCRDMLFDDAILGASIASCSFIYISTDEDGDVQMQVIDGANATGVINPVTRLLYEGYAVLDVDQKTKAPIVEAYFHPEYTEYIYSDGNTQKSTRVDNPTGYPLLVPVVLKPDAKRVFGHSRISRDLMYYQCAASRCMKRSEISAEFYSFPQKYATGVSQDIDMGQVDKWKAAMSSMLVFYEDDDHNHPVVGQFSQQSMSPHVDQLKMFASLAASCTGLTLDDLGFVGENPSSFEAIQSAHEDLNRMCLKGIRNFDVAFKNAGFVAVCLAEKKHIKRKELGSVRSVWNPLFIPNASNLASIGDGVIKLNEAIEGYIDDDVLFNLTGIEKG